jgi:L-seryl-tRNA(Ser) seleniumtransferase
VIRAAAKVGGGSLPLVELEGPAVALAQRPEALAQALRTHEPPVIARIHDGQLVLDPRTLSDREVPLVVDAVRRARAATAEPRRQPPKDPRPSSLPG